MITNKEKIAELKAKARNKFETRFLEILDRLSNSEELNLPDSLIEASNRAMSQLFAYHRVKIIYLPLIGKPAFEKNIIDVEEALTKTLNELDAEVTLSLIAEP